MNDSTSLWTLLLEVDGRRTALILPESDTHITYDSLRREILNFANALAALGVTPEDRVATIVPNGLSAVVSFFAASLVGTAAPLNPAYSPNELRFYLKDTSAKITLCDPRSIAASEEASRGTIPSCSILMDDAGSITLASKAVGHRSWNIQQSESVALVLHTSGSTGQPKRVPLVNSSVAMSARCIAQTYSLSPEDVTLCVMPLFHVHGLVASLLATLISGGTVVLPRAFNALGFWRTIRDYRVTWYSAVPTIHQMLLSRASGSRPVDIGSLRFVRSCSAPLHSHICEEMEELLGVPVLEAYGMTEAAHQVCSNPLPPAERKVGSVGKPTGVSLRIVDAKGATVSTGERGEVVIKGATVIRNYEGSPESSASAFWDGWFRTGDQGVLDDDGYLRLISRIKELINRAGEKISPQEVDDVLLTHPAISEAVTFGVSHPLLGEEVAAAIVLKEPQSESALLAYCRDRLAAFKCPKTLYVVKSLPRTATGKLQRLAVARALTSGGDPPVDD